MQITADPLFALAGRRHIAAVERLAAELAREQPAEAPAFPGSPEASAHWAEARRLLAVIRRLREEEQALDRRFREFEEEWAAAGETPQAEEVLARWLMVFARGRVSRRRARAAARRYRDPEAVREGWLEQKDRLTGRLRAAALGIGGALEAAARTVAAEERPALRRRVLELLFRGGLAEALRFDRSDGAPWALQCAGLRALRQVLRAAEARADGADADLARLADELCALARDPATPCWVRVDALDLLRELDPKSGASCTLELFRPGALPEDGGMLVRCEILERAARSGALEQHPELVLRPLEGDEPSEAVLVQALDVARRHGIFPGEPRIGELLEHASPAVRAKAMHLALTRLESAEDSALAATLRRFLEVENDPLPLQLLPHVALRRALAAVTAPDPGLPVLREYLELLARRSMPDRFVRNRCLRALNAIEIQGSPELRECWLRVREPLRELDEGRQLAFPRDELPENPNVLGRALTLVVEEEFGFEFRYSPRKVLVRKGDLYRPIFWRLLHELRNPGPAKRQAYPHYVGRDPRYEHRVPPVRLAELTPTKVPGERVYLEYEGDWRPHLPTVDDLLSLCAPRRPRVATIHSYRGVTRLRAPARSRPGLFRCYLALSAHYAELARLRLGNPYDREVRSPMGFLEQARERFGFVIQFQPAHPAGAEDWAESGDTP